MEGGDDAKEGEREGEEEEEEIPGSRNFENFSEETDPKSGEVMVINREIESATIETSSRLPSSVIPEEVHLVSKLFIVSFSSVTS